MRFTLPQNLEAEAAVLGAILQEESVLGEVSSLLAPEDFAAAKHRAIFQAMLDLDGSMEGISIITVRERLNRMGEGKKITNQDLASLADPMRFLPSAAVHHARIVREYADRRRLVQLGQELVQRAGCGQEDAKDLIPWAERAVYRLASTDVRERAAMDPKGFAQYMNTYEAVKGLPTGVDLFDRHTGGLSPGNLIVVAGRPGIGKTALGVQVAVHLASNEKVPVFFCSHEMTKAEIGWRALTLLSPGRTHFDVRERNWGADAVEKLAGSGLHITDEGEPTIEYVKGLIRARVRECGIQVVVVDHIGKIRGTRRENRYHEVGDVARGLKAVAKEVQVPVLALCQLNREVERRTSRKHHLADLRNSGAIEEEADVVAFLWTSEERMTKANVPVTLSLAKNRHGGLEDQELIFRRPYIRLEPARDRASSEDEDR